MFRTLRKGAVYTASGLSATYCTLRFICGIGKCEDVSMEPAIQHGDVVLIAPFLVDYNLLKKGDVVFCRSPKDARTVICKRLLGMEGDVMFNNEKGFEEYVEKGHIWLEGDNKEASIDSRSFGALPYGLLLSKVFIRIWPLSRIGSLSWDEKSESL